jgi:hypothetical protein
MPENKENKYIFSAVDHFTKYLRAYPLKKKSAEEVLECLKQLPDFEIYHSDNGKEFVNEMVEDYITKEVKAKFVRGMPYKPNVQGAIESIIINIFLIL